MWTPRDLRTDINGYMTFCNIYYAFEDSYRTLRTRLWPDGDLQGRPPAQGICQQRAIFSARLTKTFCQAPFGSPSTGIHPS